MRRSISLRPAPPCAASSIWPRLPCSTPTHREQPKRLGVGGSPVGLILTGGGARAAYQVGVLAGIMDILDPERPPDFVNPFDILCGTSAGAITAGALSCRAHDIHQATDHLEALWGGLHTGMVYHADAARLLRTGLRWFAMLDVGWFMQIGGGWRGEGVCQYVE